MTVWRIVRKEFAKTAFRGDGARIYGGRWNRPGIPMVYASESIALATLEMRVHFSFELALQANVLIPAIIPLDMVEVILPKSLPRGWATAEPSLQTQKWGSRWVHSQRSAVIRVPSAVVSGEHNFLINPTHSEFSRIRIGRREAYVFDQRPVGGMNPFPDPSQIKTLKLSFDNCWLSSIF